MADLATYRTKRDFTKTQEPDGDIAKAEADGFFVVQKHDASRLHYDFRLAIGGVLASWAVTRGPSLDPSDKRLAVRTEDHPIDYADFEGIIPKDEYGGGTVMVWDRGPFVAEGDPAEGLKEGKLSLILDGTRLKGGFSLVRMKPRDKRDRGRENWLLIKKDDAAAEETGDVRDAEVSVQTGRTMQEIAQDKPAKTSHPKKGAKTTAKGATSGTRSRAKDTKAAAKSSRLPAFRRPQLATLVDDPPEDGGWIFETKFDGYRILTACDGDQVVCYTRSGKDWTAKFGPIPDVLRRLKLKGALLDGEVIVTGKDGRSDFSALQNALKSDQSALSYVVFDILASDGEDLTERPLTRRKTVLNRILKRAKAPIHVSTAIEGDGDRIVRLACRRGFEGIVAKRAKAAYRAQRSRDWLKIKCIKRQEFVIGGWSPSSTKRPFASLLLGVYEGEKLRYAGRVGAGFDDDQLQEIADKLKRRARKTPPFADVPAEIARRAKWVRPDLVAEVRFAEMTRDGAVRHAVFEGLRGDKPAHDIVAERPLPLKAGKSTAKSTANREKTMSETDSETTVAGVRLTHPDRVLFPQMDVTKTALASYFDAIADVMLPELADRPVSLVRCPEGRQKSCFFQKHAGAGLPDAFTTKPIAERSGATKDYLFVADRKALVSCAQVGALELHIWGSRFDRLEKPDRMVFDLDPGDSVAFADVRRAAFDLAEVLRSAGLASYPLLTGGKGIHLVLTLERRQNWSEVTGFARAFAAKMEALDPDRFVAAMAKRKRSGRIFIDHFRNQFGSTAIAPFSPRAREGAPVAVPVGWDQLETIKSAATFSLKTDVADIASQANAWPGEADRRVRLSATAVETLGLTIETD
ncbi:DNA ligase D [Amorphus sp. 3PC139-8]|uniref:DNA ligase D n=1 Tax=Amorphus sp. 3PC139-8 TaxID=2735676 RepID=UPI00345D12DA